MKPQYYFPLLLLSLSLIQPARSDEVTRSVQQQLKDKGFYYGEATGVRDDETSAAIRRYQIRFGLKVNGEMDQETLDSIGVSGHAPSTSSPEAPTALPSVPAPTPPPAVHHPKTDRQVVQEPTPVPRGRLKSTSVQKSKPTPYVAHVSRASSGSTGVSTSGWLSRTYYADAPHYVQREVVAQVQSELGDLGFYSGPVNGYLNPATVAAVNRYQRSHGSSASGRVTNSTLERLGILQRRVVVRRYNPPPYYPARYYYGPYYPGPFYPGPGPFYPPGW
jgi:peptidoglycan hydrolase-like protein with peptidoglycan-binding domain